VASAAATVEDVVAVELPRDPLVLYGMRVCTGHLPVASPCQEEAGSELRRALRRAQWHRRLTAGRHGH